MKRLCKKMKNSNIFAISLITVLLCNNLTSLMFSKTYASSVPTWGQIIETNGNATSSNFTQINEGSNSNNQLVTSEASSINTNANISSATLVENSLTVTDNSLNLTCEGAILIEQNSGNILYNHNMHEKLRPASVTKVMSLLLIMEALDNGQISLDDKVPCTEDAANMGGSQIWLDVREELTVDEMLKAICVVSANDCTVAMADYLAGSQEAFVEKMNNRAKELGMNDTTFKNCHGIDEDGHVTSAYDIAIMSRELLMNHKQIMDYTTIYMDSLRDGKSQLVNTNKLIRNYSGATGLKTGSTSVALFNLSASATRDGLSLIAVIMRAETSKIRFSEASKLLNYGFGNYQYKQLAVKGEAVSTCQINKGVKQEIQVSYSQDYGIVLPKKEVNNISENIEIYNNVHAPVEQGQQLGEAVFTKNDGTIVSRVPLVADESVEKYGLIGISRNLYKSWFSVLRA